MKKSYFPAEGVWLKGNIHSHSTVSDGLFTPKELAELYHDHGYAFLSITDHNVLVSHSELPEDQIILLSGLEHDLEYSADKCIHVVGLASAGKEETGYLCKRYSPTELKSQQLVDMMRNDGQFISLAHPVWSRMNADEIFGLEGLHAVEVFNNGTEHLCHGGNGEIWWDMLLRQGKRVFATAVDDVHIAEDLFGGWICVKAAERSRDAILNALFQGAYYSSTGPEIYDFGLDEKKVYVSCSACREIHFVTYAPRGRSLFAEPDGVLKEACYTLTGRESYVRVVCVDHHGHSAWSNPIFFDTRS